MLVLPDLRSHLIISENPFLINMPDLLCLINHSRLIIEGAIFFTQAVTNTDGTDIQHNDHDHE